MSLRLLPALAVLAAVSPALVACTGDEPAERTTERRTTGTLDTDCARAPGEVTHSPVAGVVRVDGVLYGVTPQGVDRMQGSERSLAYASDDLGLDLLTAVDGDLVLASDERIARITVGGDVVWERPAAEDGSAPVLLAPEPVVVVGGERIDLGTGESAAAGAAVPDAEHELSRDGEDYFLADHSDAARAYLSDGGHVLVTDAGQGTLGELDGAVAVCGDRVYGLSADGATLTTYEAGEGLAVVSTVTLPADARALSPDWSTLSTTGGAVLVDVQGETWVVSD
ncbi:hypothetical protein [Pimelobacter simplex]|uniref:hypothetical protein n=1 Tax=Nocardioides simplex TaxID=2045 RepID=UPI003AAC72C9